MSWRPHGHARVNPTAPEAWGKCDRCGSPYNLADLHYQKQWAGTKLLNLRLRVCSRCMDEPQEQLRTLRLGPDPLAARDPRPLNNAAVMGGFAVMQRSAVEVYPSDSGPDAGPDSTSVQTVLSLQLVVSPPGLDAVQGYAGSPFSTEEEELTDIPLSIDPPGES